MPKSGYIRKNCIFWLDSFLGSSPSFLSSFAGGGVKLPKMTFFTELLTAAVVI